MDYIKIYFQFCLFILKFSIVDAQSKLLENTKSNTATLKYYVIGYKTVETLTDTVIF
jgi:hypothetical protein